MKNNGVITLQATIERRKKVINRLKNQLISGVKPIEPKDLINLENPNDIGNGTTPLTEKDISRIKKEISILETRLVRTKN